MSKENTITEGTNFIHNIIDKDIEQNKHPEGIVTRFPPEPNGYLHLGHSRAICVNFGIKEKYNGRCNLRLDDTNPVAEDVEYINAIKEDVSWLGFEWDELRHASHYFDELYDMATQLIKKGRAYVCSLNGDEIREYRGSLTKPGKNSPFRDRTPEENLELFEKMRAGEFPDGAHVLRAKIDMSSGNMNLRDPLLYRIRHTSHPETGDKWCIYPLYDFTHGQSDAIENITHSLCSLEFEDHRPLYEWFTTELGFANPPRQIEFARLIISHIVVSKRKLRKLVEGNFVNGWDDPRLPTLRGLRRRGYTPESIVNFNKMLGLSKSRAIIDYGLLEDSLRRDLNDKALRRQVVLDPLKVTLTNFTESITLKVPNHPQQPDLGERDVPMSSEIYIDSNDFMEEAPKKYFRLKPGGEVRLRNSYVIKCEEVLKNETGEVVELRCTVDLDTLGKSPEGRKVKGIVHWVCQKGAVPVTVNLYDRLFTEEVPDGDKERDFTEFLNPDSLKTVSSGWAEPSLKNAQIGDSFQFERVGYFIKDIAVGDSTLVFNRSVTLRDGWKKSK